MARDAAGSPRACGIPARALVSCLPNASWAKLAAEFLDAKDHPDKLQVFVNTILAQGWLESVDEIDEASLQARAELFGLTNIPTEVLVVTAGRDVQDERIETTLIGWTRTDALILANYAVWGSSLENTTWPN